MHRHLTVSLFVAAFIAAATPARAADYTLSLGTPGTGLAASAAFTNLGGGNLQIVLTNTGGDALIPADVLTAFFFNCSCGTLTPVSAVLTSGSIVLYDPDGQPAGGNVGGEWAYETGLAGAPHGATRGIGSAGFALFGSSNFNGPDLDPPDAVAGDNYGIISNSDDPTTGNQAVTGGVPLIQNSVTFVLSGYTGGTVTSNTFSNMSFQYGSGLEEPNLSGGGTGGGSGENLVPEPTSLLLLGSGLSMTAFRMRRRKEHKSR